MTTKRILTLALVSLIFLLMGVQPSMGTPVMKAMGTIKILKNNDVTIHSYMCPEDGAMVTTQIIETKNKLVVIDAQFLRPYAKEVLDYIHLLKKPVARVIVSHSHPDHWFGLEYFKGMPIYSLKETKDEIEQLGDIIIQSKKPVLGELVTSTKTVPQKIIVEGSETIDGLKYEFEKVVNAEAGVQLLIKLPELNTLIAQDLVYNDVHLFIGQNAFDGWLNALKSLQGQKQYTTILSGHGEPTDPSIYGSVVTYVEDAKEAFGSAKDGNDLKNKLLAKHPLMKAPVLLDISNSFLYKKQ